MRNAVDNVNRKIKAIDLIQDGEFKRRIDIALFLISPYMDVVVILAAVAEFVDERGIGVEVENDRLIDREERIKVAVGESVWMLCGRQQAKEVDDINETYLQVGEVAFEDRDGRQ